MGFYHKGEGRYRVYTDRERREYGERMREQERAQWREKWITRQRLKTELNWTDGAITKFLPEPEVVGTTRYGQDLKAWKVTLVKRVMKRKGFKEWLAKREAQQVKKALKQTTALGGNNG